MFAGIVPGSGVPPSRDEIRNDQWLGVAVTSQGPGEFLSIIYHLILLSLFNYELQAGRWWCAPIATRGGAWTTDGDRASASHSPTNSSLMRHGSPAEDGTLTGQLIWFTTQCSSSFYAESIPNDLKLSDTLFLVFTITLFHQLDQCRGWVGMT